MAIKSQIHGGSISQYAFHEVYKPCAKCHTFIKKCTNISYAATIAHLHFLIRVCNSKGTQLMPLGLYNSFMKVISHHYKQAASFLLNIAI